MPKIGITEKGDAGLNFAWMNRTREYDGMILITKHLSYRFIELAAKTRSIIHATITGHGGTIYEPRVPSLFMSRQMFAKLIEKIDPNRVVLRIDPIIPTDSGIAKAIYVYQELYEKMGKKTRVRISFLDQYDHVKQRFENAGLKPLDYYFHAPIELRKKIASYFPDADICGEPGFDCVGCISKKDLEILKIDTNGIDPKIGGFQREECRCLAYKSEIFEKKEQCKSGCLYCYWK